MLGYGPRGLFPFAFAAPFGTVFELPIELEEGSELAEGKDGREGSSAGTDSRAALSFCTVLIGNFVLESL